MVPHPESDELAAAALPAEAPSPDVVAHLAECERCRGEVEALQRTVDLARTGDALRAVPPARVWDGIVAELGPELGPATTEPTPSASVDEAAPVVPLQPRRPPWRKAALPAAAAAAGLLLGVGIGWVAGSTPDQPPPAPVASAPLDPLPTTAPGVVGEVRLLDAAGGRTLVVEVTDPGSAPADGYLEAWLLGGGGTRLYSLGALTPQGDNRFTGAFRLPGDLPLEQFDTVDVSTERYDGDPTHSGDSLLRGTL